MNNATTTKQNKIRIIIVSAIIILFALVSIIAIILINAENKDKTTAVIYQNGVVIQTIEFSENVDQSYVITSKNGGTNTITISNGDIYVSDADCPDKLCVKQGSARKNVVPIVCLPNKLIIVLKNSSAEKEEYDAISY